MHGDKEIDRHTHTPSNTEPLEAFYNWPRNLLFIIVAREHGRHMFQVAKWLSAYLVCIELGFIAHSRHLATWEQENTLTMMSSTLHTLNVSADS